MWKRTAVLKGLSWGQLWAFVFSKTLFQLHLTKAFTWLRKLPQGWPDSWIRCWEESCEVAALESMVAPCYVVMLWFSKSCSHSVGWYSLSDVSVRWRMSQEGCPLQCGAHSFLVQWHITKPSTLEGTTCRDAAHTISVLWRATGSNCLCGEVTGRKARSMAGLEKSGKILCCRANLQVKMMSVE